MSVAAPISTWKRFWVPHDSIIRLDEDGYLVDPEAKYGDVLNPDAVPFSEIADTPCLVLLGEPGIGKTTAMREAATEAKASCPDHCHIWRDLNQYQTDIYLVHDIFQNPDVLEWIESDRVLHLFLDGLDECLLRVDSVAALLAAELQKLPAQRLRFRIACRSAEWPRLLEDALREHSGRENVRLRELTPLRRQDVASAAEAKEIPSDLFLDEISKRQAGPLASRPITLKFLLNVFQTGQIPDKRAELYREGCLRLCDETSPSYLASRRTGSLSPAEKLTIAGRVAAVLIFCKRAAVWAGPDLGDVPDSDVTFVELEGGSESVGDKTIPVDHSSLNEVIATSATGLFRKLAGGSRFALWHQTYAEFLAADYLVRRGAAIPQMMSLITHPGDPGGRIVPQLSETAAWLAEMQPEVFQRIVRADPQVLLRSDVATADYQDKATLVDALLNLFDAEEITDHDWSLRRAYRKLDHPNLSQQLRPFIQDRSKSVTARRFAIDVVEECPHASSLQGLLADIALDESEKPEIREQAAYAVMKIGNDATRLRLKPLTFSDGGVVSTDELRGATLKSLWPSHITARELFASLKRPMDEAFYGIYQSFLRDDLTRSLSARDYPIALKWVANQLPRHELPGSFRDLVDKILIGAWNHIDAAEIRKAFARVAIKRLREHEPIVDEFDELERTGDAGFSLRNDVIRRTLVQAIVEELSDSDEDSRMLRYSGLVVSADLNWMLEQLDSGQDESLLRKWCRLIAGLFRNANVRQMDAVLLAAERIPALAEELKDDIEAVPLDSDRAREEKRWEEERKEHAKRLQPERPSDQEVKEHITKLVEQFEQGDFDAWWKLTLLLENTGGDRSSFDPDLTNMPGWQRSDVFTRNRILDAAERYLHERDAQPEEWLGRNVIYHPAAAGYRALVLLQKVCPEVVDSFNPDVWTKWAPIILGFPHDGSVDSEELRQALISDAYKRAPEEIIDTLLALIDKENEHGGTIFVTQQVANCWDNRLGKALLSKVRTGALKPSCTGQLLRELIEHRVDGAIEYAESIVQEMSTPDDTGRSRSQEAAVALLLAGESDGWSVVWAVIQGDTEFGRKVLLDVAHSPFDRPHSPFGRYTARFAHYIHESDAADLYIWLSREFPHREDPKHDGAHGVGPRESIADFRDSILRDLQSRGTVASKNAIERIVQELPDLDWLKWILVEARKATLQHTWMPPTPRVLLRLVSREEGRLVESGEQLLEVLLESIDRLNKRLEESTVARCLWNETPRKTPKDESALSDFLKDHFDQDLIKRGIIVNREVKIHHGKGAKKGELTDIHVDAVTPGQGFTFDRIRAIIEVKGQWHGELKTAMKSQLRDRYMTDYDCQYGLYVVGWFDCPAWDEADKRKRNPWKWLKGEAFRILRKQATKLSQQGILIKVAMINAELR